MQRKNISNADRNTILSAYGEIGSLIFPRVNANFARVPNMLNTVDFNISLDALIGANIKECAFNADLQKLIKDYASTFDIKCIVSVCLTELLQDKSGTPIHEFVGDKMIELEQWKRPKFKISTWHNRLTRLWYKTLSYGLTKIKKTKNEEVLGFEDMLLEKISMVLTKSITDELQDNGLLTFAESQEKSDRMFFTWAGDPIVLLPKTLALPMLREPEDWQIMGDSGKAALGGYMFSSLTEISYQGHMASLSASLHEHRLHLKQIDHINKVQKTSFCINYEMLEFIQKNKEALTEAEILLVSNKLLGHSVDGYKNAVTKIKKQSLETEEESSVKTRKQENYLIFQLLRHNEEETIRNLDVLEAAEHFVNKELYWPIVHDFRGRIYRVGYLNPQLNELVRSLLCFKPCENPIKRRKQSTASLNHFNLLLKAIVKTPESINRWDAIFSSRQINNESFMKLLLDDLVAKQLNLLQVGQLLALRAGKYSQIGVHYDATASAYQIIGVLCFNVELCTVTNIISTSKQDLYSNLLQHLKVETLEKLINDHGLESIKTRILEHFDCALLKSGVMPLIYGKTSLSYSKDLLEGLKLPKKYSKELIAFASSVQKWVKEQSFMHDANIFIKSLRGFARSLCDIQPQIVIENKFYYSEIDYCQIENFSSRVYQRKTKTQKEGIRRIALQRRKRDGSGIVLRSKRKATGAFVANYIHFFFLDAFVCHSVLQDYADPESEAGPRISSIHDSFFVPPKNAPHLQKIYKNGLKNLVRVHEYNMLNWCLQIFKFCR